MSGFGGRVEILARSELYRFCIEPVLVELEDAGHAVPGTGELHGVNQS
jgi:hypothetical protein